VRYRRRASACRGPADLTLVRRVGHRRHFPDAELVRAARSARGDRYAAGLIRRIPGLDRVVDRVLAPLEPAAVVDGDPRPTHQVRVEPGLACSPAGPAIE